MRVHRRPRLPGAASLSLPPDQERLRSQLYHRLPAEAAARLPAWHVGADVTESVHVTTDARGAATDVEISHRWRDRLPAEGFAAAVFDAYSTARERAVEAFTLAVLAAEKVGADPPRPPVAPVAHARRTPPAVPAGEPADWRAWIRGIVERGRARPGLPRDAAGYRYHAGPYGCLTAVLHGRAVVGLLGDLLKIRYAETEFLQAEALDVLSAGRR